MAKPLKTRLYHVKGYYNSKSDEFGEQMGICALESSKKTNWRTRHSTAPHESKKEVKENIEILTFLLASLLFLAVRHLEDGPVEALREWQWRQSS